MVEVSALIDPSMLVEVEAVAWGVGTGGQAIAHWNASAAMRARAKRARNPPGATVAG
jgi:hypothetical protein